MPVSVYTDVPSRNKRANLHYLFTFGGAGVGCLLLAVLVAFVISWFGLDVDEAKYREQPVKVQTFLTCLQEHNYERAEGMLSDDGKRRFSAKHLQSTVEAVESQLGRVQRWQSPFRGGVPFNSQYESRLDTYEGEPTNVSVGSEGKSGTVSRFVIPVFCTKGVVQAYFVFRSNDRRHPSVLIDAFELKGE